MDLLLIGSSNRPPSKETSCYWLTADHPGAAYLTSQEDESGKFMVFVKEQDLDATWEKVKQLTQKEQLGFHAKCATAVPNPTALKWKWGQKWGQAWHSEMGSKWGQNGVMGSKWGQAWHSQNGVKMGSKWGQNGVKMGSKWGQAWHSKWGQNGVKMGSKMGSKWGQAWHSGI